MNNLLDTILTNKTLKSKSQEDENENDKTLLSSKDEKKNKKTSTNSKKDENKNILLEYIEDKLFKEYSNGKK